MILGDHVLVQFAAARVAIADRIDRVVMAGEFRIGRTIAAARAWIHHWPNPPKNRRSTGQFWRHAKERREKRNSQV
jgi:hypothetical protein